MDTTFSQDKFAQELSGRRSADEIECSQKQGRKEAWNGWQS